VYKFYVENLLKRWFNKTLEERQFAKAQKLATIYGQLFGNSADELFTQVAAAKASRAPRG
jgi:hypothetical protein